MASLVLTVIGDDRSGLVDSLAGVIAEHGGNWERSQMAELAGKFAGIVLVTVPDGRVDELTDALEPLESSGLLDITAATALEEPDAGEITRISLELMGTDHPGIVADVSHTLATRGISIEELSTETREAPMAGGTLFEASAILAVPSSVALAELREALEELANALMVDIRLDPA